MFSTINQQPVLKNAAGLEDHEHDPYVRSTSVTEKLGMTHKEPRPKGCSSQVPSSGSGVYSPASLFSLCEGRVAGISNF